ncbi:DivIVA domain-containing protein [Arcanobacterium canis]|uniref:Cell wall synthesis protein Wag31 n=1 Tax=Arcanobacterium canis TaxID=999183 RepID=A0ABY8G0T3_9ACTO|nr:DivIVA domain-containing protein [Arcanobacterium canis]WFM82796.1 DivIVA domain-containing protein [Arcanobacterium canis]
MAQLLTETDVVNMRFKEPQRVEEGYDQDEVDFFLDEVAYSITKYREDTEKLRAELQAAQARVTELENQGAQAVSAPATDATSTAALASTPNMSEAQSATGMLSLAQRLHDEYVANGKAESERIVSEAEAEKTRIITEAEEVHNRTLTKLEEERSVLERKIAELREFERDYRTRLKSYLESLLANVDSKAEQK